MAEASAKSPGAELVSPMSAFISAAGADEGCSALRPPIPDSLAEKSLAFIESTPQSDPSLNQTNR
jgi:hypothetical protein